MAVRDTSIGSELSAEFVEREYNLRAAFPDHPQWFAKWAADSAAARSRLRSRLDLRYGAGRKQTLDVFPGEPSGSRRGTLLFIHGGYWRALDKNDHSFVAPAFVDQGINVVVVNYDLCPDVSVARIVEQCREAVAWLAHESRAHGLDVGPLIVSGHSAGGHLAAMLFATDWSVYGVDAALIEGGVSISGIFDLEPMCKVWFNTDLQLDSETARAISPVHFAPRVRAPMLLTFGAGETSEFGRQARLLWERWPACRPVGAAGPVSIPDRHHFSVLSDLGDRNSGLCDATLRMFPRAT